MSRIVDPATMAQAEQIADILFDWNDGVSWMPKLYSREETIAFARMMIGNGWVRVVRQQDQVMGFVARDGAMIHALYVKETHRSRKIGATLIKDAQCGRDNLTLWVFERNHQAQAFYQSHGFVEVERSDGAGNDEKLPDIRYVWHRSASR